MSLSPVTTRASQHHLGMPQVQPRSTLALKSLLRGSATSMMVSYKRGRTQNYSIKACRAPSLLYVDYRLCVSLSNVPLAIAHKSAASTVYVTSTAINNKQHCC